MRYLYNQAREPLLEQKHEIGRALEAAGMAIHEGRLEIRELRSQSPVDEELIVDWRSGVASARLEQRALLGELAAVKLQLVDYVTYDQGWKWIRK